MNRKELRGLIVGTLIDLACIGSMLMQVQNPATYWDYLGGAGYFFQAAFIWSGLLFLPLVLVSHHILSRNGVNTEVDVRAAVAMEDFQSHAAGYQRAVLVRELLFCLIFSGMGWIWLAIGNLLAIWMLFLVWNSPKLQPVQAA